MQQTASRPGPLKRTVYGVVFGFLLLAVTLAGIEAVSATLAPAWPARALRSTEPVNPLNAGKMPFAPFAWILAPYNSWGLRDGERSIAKPAGAFRAAIVGDSFVESAFTPLSLPAAIERAAAGSIANLEAVNLGISGTNPRSYYFRIRDVALSLSPDAIVLVFYVGNDFVPADEGYSTWPRLVDESPGGSMLGRLMPRTNWLLNNRLRLAEIFSKAQVGPPGEEEMIFNAITQTPGRQGVKRLAALLHEYRFPKMPEAQIAKIIGRGDERLLREAAPRDADQEFAMGWMLDMVVRNTSESYPVPANREEAIRMAGKGIPEATLSWLEAMASLAASHHVPFVTFIAPVGTVDPDYVEFWKPWPHYYGWNLICNEWYDQLVTLLPKSNVKFVDLRRDLEGVSGTYRKLDGHWTRKGEKIVADRIARELAALRNEPGR